MRSRLLSAALGLAALPLVAFSAAAAPMSTSDLLRPQSAVETARCTRYCHAYGHCGHGYKKHRCCKVWKQRCSYGHKHHHHRHHHKKRHH